MFRHPAWAVGSCSSGPPTAVSVGTKSTGGFYRPDLSPCTGYVTALLGCQARGTLSPFLAYEKIMRSSPYPVVRLIRSNHRFGGAPRLFAEVPLSVDRSEILQKSEVIPCNTSALLKGLGAPPHALA